MMQKMHPDSNKLLCAAAALREKSGVQARFLLGPAGSGKTFRCLAEIRAALRENADGPPLVLLAPKQATFQLERQLLADQELAGYTRLHIFSFDRLARYVLEKLSARPAGQLNDEGRVMVLRALLLRHEKELKLFRLSARRPGFAKQLSQLLGELQQHQFTPARLRQLAAQAVERRELQEKLLDLALLGDAYARWLAEHELPDGSCLLNFAADALHSEFRIPDSGFRISGLWLDGFAEMTPQEQDLLAAILPGCGQVTVAFCLETEPEPDATRPWLSIWSAIAKTYQQCRQRIENLPDCKIAVERLRRDAKNSRFAKNSGLARLEQNWASSFFPNSELRTPNFGISLAVCTNPEAEAALAAREMLRFVHGGGRFRDCAVLVRNLDNYHKPVARVFRRYHIPFFLDRRESVAHHPLAELTRSALRLVAFDWPHDDWFAALKAGFSSVPETEIDRLENAGLEFGWRGKKWREPIQIAGDPGLTKSLERLRGKISPPFENFAAQLALHNHRPAGPQLANALRGLWNELRVEETLAKWNLPELEGSSPVTRHPSFHSTVWEQMNGWLDNVALAFSDESLSLRDWLPILEAGLTNLTVGVIPPALDHVLVGAVDRARNPDLKLAFVLGANEGIFPEVPAAPPILTHADRDELEQYNAVLGSNLRDQLARERYLGYIACTRAGKKLYVTFSRHDVDGRTLNPSSLVAHLQALFPELEVQKFHVAADWREAEHANELVTPLVEICSSGRQSAQSFPVEKQSRLTSAATGNWAELLELPALKSLAGSLRRMREPDPAENLSPGLAAAVYSPTLQTSVSRLEEFAQCPFRFFVHSGLRAEERKVFKLDARERGSFQHEVLKMFHERLSAEGKRWRDLTPAEARQCVGRIAAELAPDYRDGLLRADDQGRFTARVLAESLQDFVETLVTWMRGQYEFDPVVAELEFGFGTNGAPAWEIDLGSGRKLALRGRIDRIDLWRETTDRAWCVVMDYKSGRQKLDRILVEHGVQLQLLGYLAALRCWPNPRALLGVKHLVPAGVFYVNLRGKYDGSPMRTEVLADADESRRLAYRHTGRFSVDALPGLDRRSGAKAGDQFNYRRNNDGSLHKGSTEVLPRAEFEALLDRVETQLTETGRAIFAGEASVDPYRAGSETPCGFCDYRAVCRIDPWTHHYRVLRASPKVAEA
ncbi:MAG TPA: PD-(D/E)XK nuclease family protein [Verrucomicrobiae bacterium]|nr:PD-(D/E)XK nuclease family protein [Verrucomicrobiae bacterium]